MNITHLSVLKAFCVTSLASCSTAVKPALESGREGTEVQGVTVGVRVCMRWWRGLMVGRVAEGLSSSDSCWGPV